MEGTLWFAKIFSDGEGWTGVGGFGYFDNEQRAYKTFSPEEIRKWPATAMVVERDAVWIGLAHNGEWGGSGGGVARFDRGTERVSLLGFSEIVWEMQRVGDTLAMATEFGVALFDGNKVRRFFVDETTDGRRRVAEGLGSSEKR